MKNIFYLFFVILIFGCSNSNEKYFELAKKAQKNSNSAEAIRLYSKAIKIDEHNYKAYYLRGLAHYNTKDYKSTFYDLAYYLNKYPKDLSALSLMLTTKTCLSDTLESQKIINRAISLDSTKADFHYFAAVFNLLKEDKVAACNSLEIASSFYQKNTLENKIMELQSINCN